jgi:hypothetical protein
MMLTGISLGIRSLRLGMWREKIALARNQGSSIYFEPGINYGKPSCAAF